MTSKLTRDRLAEIAQFGFSSAITPANDFEIKELARMALAALDSEPDRNPVLAYADSYRDMAKQGVESVQIWSVITDLERNIAPLYRHAQPAPVVPDAYVRDERGRMMLNGVCEPKIGFGIGWNACRAAMLDRQLVDHVDEESLTSINPAPDLVSLPKNAKSLTGNSPVIPDGSFSGLFNSARALLDALYEFGPDEIAISEHVTNLEDALRNAAAPQSPGSEPATVPGKWIPVSEQMPPSRHEVLVGRWWGEKPRWCCKWATYIPGHPDAQSSGWLIPGGSWMPTHWMELPAAPQEAINELIPLVSRNEQEGK